MHIKQTKKNSRIVKNGVDYLLQLAITRLALSKELLFILNNLQEAIGFEVVFKSLGDLLIMQGQVPKKKNKKPLNKWLEENTPEEAVGNEYFELKEAI